MRIISWNVNGLRSIIRKGFKKIVDNLDADVICLQEIKTRKAIKGFSLEGYNAYYNYSTIGGYSGVAIFARKKPNNVYYGINIGKKKNIDNEARVITIEYNDYYIVNVYVPHPQTKGTRRDYRDKFCVNFNKYIKSLRKNVIICGDFNVCHKDIDIYNMRVNKKQKGFVLEERDTFSDLLDIGLIDTFRYMHPKMRKYTLKASNIQELNNNEFGWRIDYILTSNQMSKEIREANILNEVSGSDHCPIELVLNFNHSKNLNLGNKTVLYMPKEYIKNVDSPVYIRADLDSDLLGDIWQNFDFDKAEDKIFKLQCKLTKAAMNNNTPLRIKLQNQITHSTEARMLAVRKVAERSKASPGIDGVEWNKASDKMRAAINLNNGIYKAKPLRQIIFRDKKTGKARQLGIPTVYDRSMQVLYSYALEPVEEALADRRSFAFRKGKSPELMHAFIMNTLNDKDAPTWFLISDIRSYYNSISHKWLIENIPMDKHVLKEFLNSKYLFNGELFDSESGISLGCNISTLIGNMTLDGLQKALYDLQGENIKDFQNGKVFRFADDVLITAKSKEDALKFKKALQKFITARGLVISEEKTKIKNIREGFDFISRFYCKVDGIIRCIPSEYAVENFKKEMEALIFNNIDRWSLNKMINNINSKITGFATYHKIEESMETFVHLDAIINALLLKMVKKMHPSYSNNHLIQRYWRKDSLGRYVFGLGKSRRNRIKNMVDTILVEERTIDLKRNIFLDREYFKNIEEGRDIQNCIGRYRKIFDRQDGKCYFCSKDIMPYDEKMIIYKKSSKDKTIRNMAYIHKQCENQVLKNVNVNEDIGAAITLKELLNEFNNEKKRKKSSKFKKLFEYFHNINKKSVQLSFKTIEKILNFNLCSSAYKYRSYFLNNKPGMISEAWINNGYKIRSLDIKNQKIVFEKIEYKRKLNIPDQLYRKDLSTDAINEANDFFMHFIEKYRL